MVGRHTLTSVLSSNCLPDLYRGYCRCNLHVRHGSRNCQSRQVLEFQGLCVQKITLLILNKSTKQNRDIPSLKGMSRFYFYSSVKR
ncbi:hypothetical protein CIP107550_01594 [Corynebacterium diphtheriae]|nr:hypothetical protein CIP107550_01594 [Corynebacterium diphtheriae]